MSQQASAKKAGKKKSQSPMPRVAVAIYAVAALFLILPMYEWITNAAFFLSPTPDWSMLLLNLPARLFALVGFVLMFYQFVLGVRTPLFEKVFNRATNLKRHRTLGKVGFVLILLHGLFMLAYEWLIANQIILDYYRVLGVTALILLIIAVVSAWFFKPLKLSRKAWKTIHLLAYFVFPLGFEHGRNLGTEFATGAWTVRGLFTGLFFVYCAIVLYRLYTWFNEVRASRAKRSASTA